MSMYGTRDASANWEAEYTRTMVNGGFVRGHSSPCHFFHRAWDVRVLVHGDDFVAVGPRKGLDRYQKLMEETYETKVERIGPGPNDEHELRILGRMISYQQNGIHYEPDPRHVEAVIRDLGLQEAKAVVTPCAKEADKLGGSGARTKQIRIGMIDGSLDQPESSPSLGAEEATKYASLSARLNYLSLDRVDIMYSVKELMRKLTTPTEQDMSALKRVARYLIGRPRQYQEFRWQRMPKKLTTFTDSDFAGCLRTRKSTSGGA